MLSSYSLKERDKNASYEIYLTYFLCNILGYRQRMLYAATAYIILEKLHYARAT